MKPVNNINKAKKIIESLKKSSYFQTAFTHTSYCNEDKSAVSYETLEFLGDSILNFHTTLFIYHNFPNYSEGEMSKMKQLMVQERTLADLGRVIGWGEYLRLGAGERKNKGDDKDSILADVFESFLAALYLEKGSKKVVQFLELTLFWWVKDKTNLVWDYKTQLQEYCQAQKNNKVYYRLIRALSSRGKSIFVVEVSDRQETFLERGEGNSKKKAEQNAASKVIEKLGIKQK
ncbi:MAG: ribonuclease III [Candidatus Moeniiplasma glomeromycotorum]|nr:ribonuclease III [Candidatus Moeniiplasma glomeromycotorum]MCE8168073.1 ribonuclease III [Candidatus Moeniiplasma glomeromycotorum]MCE8169618.1 ribonuclease III [Candidatus Moeniiplasma glomeromycotorum]